MKVQLSFIYEGPLNEKLDKRLRLLAEEIGFEWYGQGTHLETGRRDLAFSADIEALFPRERAQCLSSLAT